MTRMTSGRETRREQIEEALAILAPVPLWQQQIEIRIKQAIERDRSLGPLLEPGLDMVQRICVGVERAGTTLGEFHAECEAHGW